VALLSLQNKIWGSHNNYLDWLVAFLTAGVYINWRFLSIDISS